MTLNEFEQELMGEVQEFAKQWRDEHTEAPDEWPLNMNEGDWFEQFISHISR